MSITLASLQENIAELTLKVGDNELTIRYRPGKFTHALRSDLLSGESTYLDTLASLLVDWDVLDDKGKPLPVTADVLATLPLAFVEGVAQEVVKSSLANPQIKATSAST